MTTLSQDIRGLVGIGRPALVAPAVLVAVAGYLATSAGNWSPLHLSVLSLAVLGLGMASWSVNEVADAESDRFGRKTSAWSVYVSGGTGVLTRSRRLWWAAVGVSVLEALGGVGLLLAFGRQAALLGLCFLACGLGYSIRPVRFKARGLAGPIVTAVAYSGVSFLIGASLAASRVTAWSMVSIVVLFLVCVAVECIPAVIDCAGDAAAGDGTIAVRWGKRATTLLAVAAMSAASLIVLVFCLARPIGIGPSGLSAALGVALGITGLLLCSACLLVRTGLPLMRLRLCTVLWFCALAVGLPLLV